MSKQTVNDELTTVAGAGSAIALHAQSYGFDIIPICRALDIDPDDLQSLTARISLDRMCRLLEACALMADDEAFGLKCAAGFTLGSSGPFGYGMMTAPTVHDFLDFLVDHLAFASQVRDCSLQKSDTGSVLSWNFAPSVSKRDQYVDLIVSLHLRHLGRLVGEDIDRVAVGLQRQRPRHPAFFRQHMTRHLSFGMPVNSLHVPASLLDRRNPRGDPNLFKLMNIQIRTLQADEVTEEEFVEQVRRYIRRRIAEATLSLDLIAAYFGLSERTFQRRLAEFGTTLNDLRDDERRRLCLALLRDGSLSITTISYRLGYSAPSAFTRSVYRWFGASPKTLRNINAEESSRLQEFRGDDLDAPIQIGKIS